jgi:acyl-CoA reductase-like NAD-dependent aldehyde dehydrogenase
LSSAQEIGRLVSLQNGMPIALSPIIEGLTAAGTLRYMVSLLATSPVEEETSRFLGGDLVIRHEPIGVIAGIVPWNYPQTLSAFKYAPALAAGNTIVLKPSPETVLDSYVFAEAVIAAGLPAGVINIVPGGRELGAYLVQHRDVDKVAFTGSTAAGRQIAEICGRLLRPVSLELGGKSAAIILDDADLDLAKIGQNLFSATLVNNGQTCYAGTRILAPASRYTDGDAGSRRVTVSEERPTTATTSAPRPLLPRNPWRNSRYTSGNTMDPIDLGAAGRRATE